MNDVRGNDIQPGVSQHRYILGNIRFKAELEGNCEWAGLQKVRPEIDFERLDSYLDTFSQLT